VGIFRRIGRAIARVLRPSTPPEPPDAPPPGPPGGPGPGFFDDEPPGAPTGVDNWFIMATWDGPGTKQRYTGPDDLRDLSPSGQVTVAYRDPDTGLLHYRTIHGPFPNDALRFIDDEIEFTVRTVSPP
jgi:hypothetical protein